MRFEKRAEIDKTNRIPDPSVISSCVDLLEKDEQIAEHEKVTDVHGIENVVFKKKYSETLIAFLEKVIFQWQSVGHTVANCASSNAQQAASSSSSKPAAATRMQAKQVTVEVGVLEQMDTEDRRGEAGRARARL